MFQDAQVDVVGIDHDGGGQVLIQLIDKNAFDLVFEAEGDEDSGEKDKPDKDGCRDEGNPQDLFPPGLRGRNWKVYGFMIFLHASKLVQAINVFRP